MSGTLTLERWLDMPRSIVWDSLIDPVLVEGWLHPTATLIDGEVLERTAPAAADPDLPAVLAVRSPEFGAVRIELVEAIGGTRGTSTELWLDVALTIPREAAAPVEAGWQVRLDQLEGLLHGHPVDWRTWATESGPDYAAYLDRAVRTLGVEH